MKKLLLFLSIIFLTACQHTTVSTTNDPTAPPVGLANPASTYCVEQGGKIEIRENEVGQYGQCIFSNGNECDEWAFYNGLCGPDGDIEPANDGVLDFNDCVKAGNPVMESYPRQCRHGDRTFTEVIDEPITPPSAPTDDVPQICTADYTPVCALIQVQCIKAPCPPLFQTKGNECNAKSLGSMLLGHTPGECEEDLETECKTDADCTLPGEWAIMSRCPFDAKCVAEHCVVVCPQTHASGSPAL